MCIVIQDSREQRPLKIDAFRVEIESLSAGDYGIRGFSDLDNPQFIVEHKTLTDLIRSLNGFSKGKPRFVRQIEKMRCFEHKALLIEAHRFDVESGAYVSQTSPRSILGRLDAICADAQLRVFWCGDPEGAARQLESLVRNFIDAIPSEAPKPNETPTQLSE